MRSETAKLHNYLIIIYWFSIIYYQLSIRKTLFCKVHFAKQAVFRQICLHFDFLADGKIKHTRVQNHEFHEFHEVIGFRFCIHFRRPIPIYVSLAPSIPARPRKLMLYVALSYIIYPILLQFWNFSPQFLGKLKQKPYLCLTICERGQCMFRNS